jgi:hypothetical protein
MASSSTAVHYQTLSRWIKERQPAVEHAVAVLLAALCFWKGIVAGIRTLNTDFPNYYVAARLIRERYCLDRIYDWIWFQRASDHFGIDHQLTGFLGLTPFSALSVLPLAKLPVMEAKALWILFNVVLMTLTIHVLVRITGIEGRRAWLIGLCAVIPLRTNFLLGQMHLVVLALLVASFAYHMRGRQIASGCCVALAGALKIYPLFFCFYFIAKRRWNALAAVVVCIVGCVVLSYVLVGPAAMYVYLHEQLPHTLQGASQNPFLSTTTSAAALFHRLFLFEPELNPHPLISSPLLYATLYPLWQAAFAGMTLSRLRFRFLPDSREALEWASFVTLLLFLSSAPATYHYVVLIGPAIITAAVLTQTQRSKAAGVFLVLYIAACNLGTVTGNSSVVSVFTPLHYLKLYAGAALLLFYYVILSRDGPGKTADGSHVSAPMRKAAVILLCLWAVGFASTWTHLRHICPDCSRRITPSDSAYLRRTPFDTDKGLMYVAMLGDGYRILQNGKPLIYADENNRYPPDQFSFTASTTGREIWIEEAVGPISRVVRVASAHTSGVPCELRDAESPSLSRDGSWLAFIREDHGHGSLWLFDPGDCSSHENRFGAMKITPSTLDVRTMAVGSADSWIVSAVAHGKEDLYAIVPGRPPQLMVDAGSDLNSPSLAPDGTRLVARRWISGHWQLVALNLTAELAARTETQLTFGDCDAYAPSWKDDHTILYATDCMRGSGLTGLAWINPRDNPIEPRPSSILYTR